jgi:pimeloyl-ACP methyl ester carboxylesterase
LKQVDGGWTWAFDPYLWNHFRMPDPLLWVPRVATPFTVIRGRDSMLATEEIWAYMRTIAPPQTRWVSVANARHHLMLDEPLATLAALSTVLSVQFA